jgi:transposase InsO family protein
MKEEKLLVKISKRRKYSSYAGEITQAAPNYLKRNFKAARPNEKWLTDLTEFRIPAGKVYLSPLVDCYDGAVISWTIGTQPNADLVNKMLDTGILQLKENEKPIIHSDRGAHYRWPEWIKKVKAAGLICSMSKKGCSPDNSACEGFFGRLKNEMFYNHDWSQTTLKQFIKHLDGYLHWYNEKRIKISLGGISPLQYREQNGCN